MYIYIDATPVEEDCVQCTEDFPYVQAMLAEAGTYRKQLKEKFPEATFKVIREEHDFGPYYSILSDCFEAELGMDEWTEQSLNELRQNEAWRRYWNDYHGVEKV